MITYLCEMNPAKPSICKKMMLSTNIAAATVYFFLSPSISLMVI